MITPFSGLSLIIHLIVIAFGTVRGLLFKKKIRVLRKERKEETRMVLLSKSTLSVLIILAVTSFMFVSFFLAIKSGIHQGLQEPQIIYIREELAGLKPVHVEAQTDNVMTKN